MVLSHNYYMARPRKDIDASLFSPLYNKWERGIVNEQEMCRVLGVSRSTLVRRMAEYRTQEPMESIRLRVFYKNDAPFLLDEPNLAKANPGFVDRMIVGEYAIAGGDTYSCEKSFRRLSGAVVVG